MCVCLKECLKRLNVFINFNRVLLTYSRSIWNARVQLNVTDCGTRGRVKVIHVYVLTLNGIAVVY